MKNFEEIKGRCVITEDGHWLWKGALREDGRAHIHAPDYTHHNGCLVTQSGPRAMWHALSERAVPEGSRVIGTCAEMACVAPWHILCVTEAEYGERMRESGRFKKSAKRTLANRAIGRARAVVNQEMIAYIQNSPKTGLALSKELGIAASTVSRARRGEHVAFQSAGPFTGLIRGAGA